MREDSGGGASLKRSPSPGPPPEETGGRARGCEGGGFSERSPSLALPPEERRAFGGVPFSYLVPPVRWVRFSVRWLRSRRLTEPPRPLRRGAASAGAGFRLCGGDQRALRSPFGNLRPNALSQLYCTQRWQAAAALSAAVTTTKQQETALTLRRNQVSRKTYLKRQLLFGRGGLGERRLLSEKPPLPQNLPATLTLLRRYLFEVS